MKVIDLLNKIAKDEEVPKKIKWGNDEWEYSNGELKNYLTDYEDLFTVIDGSNLNDEVEIIEDKPKHIKEIYVWYEFDGKNNDEIIYHICTELKDKINELSKAVNYLLDKEGK